MSLDRSKLTATIGLEVHVMQKTQSKMFCSCPCAYDAKPNTNVCPTCLGLPGALPIANEKAIELCCKIGLMLDCEINLVSQWDRKHYFYPDMAKNYQVTQSERPFCLGGHVDAYVDGELMRFELDHIHQEENAAKSIHDLVPGQSAIDYNRAGTALIEIVTMPCMHSVEEVSAFLSTLKQTLQYADISDCNMELGQMRADVNVSVNRAGDTELGSKVEIKNMNSVSFIGTAIQYEIKRQSRILESGGSVRQETRGFDSVQGITLSQRSKEDSPDYRYFPEPDLMPVVLFEQTVEQWKSELPESPIARTMRFVDECGIAMEKVQRIVPDKVLSDWFDRVLSTTDNAKALTNLTLGKVKQLLSSSDYSILEKQLAPERLSKVIQLMDDQTISSSAANTVIEKMYEDDLAPEVIIDKYDLKQVSGGDELTRIVECVVKKHPEFIEKYRQGNRNSINFLMGQVMRETKGSANPGVVMKMIESVLENGGSGEEG